MVLPDRSGWVLRTARMTAGGIAATALITALTTALTTALVASPAMADTVATGAAGQRLSVSQTTGLLRSGQTLSVSGSGYDVEKGIYVAFCVDKGPGAVPSPCGGGADTSGSSGSSVWISSNPPSYGEGLAIPYGPGGSFQVTIAVTATIGTVDCTVTRCAVVTRADHTRTSDRSQDVRAVVTFAAAGGTGAGASAGSGTGNGSGATTSPRTSTGPAGSTGNSGTRSVPSVQATATATGSAGPLGVAASGTAAAGPDELAIARVSQSRTEGGWWYATVVGLAGLVAALVIARVGRARRLGRDRDQR